MNTHVEDLLKHLTLDRLEKNLFQGESKDLGGKSVFGGQVLAQALIAAGQTVEGREVHSLHGYFLRPGDMQTPIVYEVERIRDGRSFATRRIVAIQHGRAIFNMSASFQIKEEGIEHQLEMPVVPGPDGLPTKDELNRQVLENMSDEVIPETMRKMLTRKLPIEFRPVPTIDTLPGEPRAASRQMWFRAREALPDLPEIHKAVLTYASDFSLLGTTLLPHGLSFLKQNVQMASLDHAMWFHRDFRIDEWLLYVMDSPSASNARGLSRGSIFSCDGKLVASVAQEGVVRRAQVF